MSNIHKTESSLLDVLTDASFLLQEPYVENRWNLFLDEIETIVSKDLLPLLKKHLSTIQSLKQKEAHLSFTAKTLELFQQINKEVTSLAPLESILNLSANKLRDISKANVLIALLDKNRKKIHIEALSGLKSEELIHYEQELEQGVCRLVAKFKKPFVVTDYLLEKHLIDPLAQILMEKEGIRSIISAPLLLNGDLIGIVFLAREHPYSSSKAHIKMLNYYCSQVAIAINNARLYANELRISSLHQTIFEAALDQGYSSILQKLADFIHYPNLLIDGLGNNICDVRPSKYENKLIDCFCNQTLLFEKILSNSKSHLGQSSFALHLDEAVYTAFPIHLHEQTVAYLIIPTTFGEHDYLDIMAIEQSKNVLSLKISQEHTRTEVELRLRQDYLYDLINGLESEEDLLRRGSYLKIDFQKPHDIVILLPSDKDNTEANNKHIIQALEKIRYQLGISTLPLSIVNRQKLVIVTPTLNTNDISKKILYYFKKFCPLLNATVGVSKNVSHPKDYARGYNEAKKAAEFADQLGKKGEIVHFEDLGIVGVLFEANNFNSMMYFCEKYLDALIKHDSIYHTDLINTLQVYLDNESVIQSSSEQLHVHYNTLRYRLNRIEEITGLDLKDAQNKLNIRIALIVYCLLNSDMKSRS